MMSATTASTAKPRAGAELAAFFLFQLAVALWLLPWLSSTSAVNSHGQLWGGDFGVETVKRLTSPPQCICSIRCANEGPDEPERLRFLSSPHPCEDSPAAQLHKFLAAGLAGVLAAVVVASNGSWFIRGAMAALLTIVLPLWTLLAENYINSDGGVRSFPNFQNECAVAIVAQSAIWAIAIFGSTVVVLFLAKGALPLRFGSPTGRIALSSISETLLLAAIFTILFAAWTRLRDCHPASNGGRELHFLLGAARVGAEQGWSHFVFYGMLQIPLIWGAVYFAVRYAKPSFAFFAVVIAVTFLLCILQHRYQGISIGHTCVAALIEFLFIVVAIGVLQAQGWFGLDEKALEEFSLLSKRSGKKRPPLLSGTFTKEFPLCNSHDLTAAPCPPPCQGRK